MSSARDKNIGENSRGVGFVFKVKEESFRIFGVVGHGYVNLCTYGITMRKLVRVRIKEESLTLVHYFLKICFI